MSNDVVAYSYINVGHAFDSSEDAVPYVYWNTVDRSAPSVIGRVTGFAARPNINQAYSYINLGYYLDSSEDGTAYVYWNQLEQESGATRLLEDGTTARHLEDDTTERILE